jgi:phosphoribosyl 1,2-cyclic phosphodiesterase
VGFGFEKQYKKVVELMQENMSAEEFWAELDRIDNLVIDLKQMRGLLDNQIAVNEAKLEEMNARWDAVARESFNLEQ